MTKAHILVLNSGSSSLKFTLLDVTSGERFATGLAERLGAEGATLAVSVRGEKEVHPLGEGGHADALQKAVSLLREHGLTEKLFAIGHRIVHGGELFAEPTVVTDQVISDIEGLGHLAPLHNRVNALGIRAAKLAFPELPQVVVFDTAFHRTMPEVAYRYAVPSRWYTDFGVRRYGFHGTSHAFVTEEAARRLGRPSAEVQLLTAHLGNGASATAISHGRSVDTTMGMTPLAGLVMGTRSGSIDPAIVLYMSRRLPGGVDEVDDALNRKSGLLGLSKERSNDMRTLLAAERDGDADAKLAVDVFCYRLAAELAALRIALPSLDALVFTGGIGEHSAEVRQRVVERLGFLNLKIDEARNASNGRETNGDITAGEGPRILVIPTDEEWLIASQTRAAASAH